jgi:alcohol dehydrogenase class IV
MMTPLVITDAEAKFKFTIGSPQAARLIAFPRSLLVRPAIQRDRATGMDAPDAIELHLAVSALSEVDPAAIRLISANLRTGVANSHNLACRAAAGQHRRLAFSTRVGNAHATAHPLGTVADS